MKTAFAKVEEIEKRDVQYSIKVAAWDRFLSGFSENVSESVEDDQMRRDAIQRRELWENPVIKGPLSGMEFVLIPGGSFQMGSK